jgi:hypothetical protein
MHWFCPNDLSYCVGGRTRKYVVVRSSILTLWPIQEGIDLTQKKVTTLEEVGFSFDCNRAQSLFGF